MNLIAHKFDGRRVAVQHEPIHSYSAALDLARAHYRFNNDTAALYLQADGQTRIVRTYVRAEPPSVHNGYVEVLGGYHEWPTPPTMVPATSWPEGRLAFPWGETGVYPVPMGDEPITRFDEVEVSAMLERADWKGYQRGFKVGISHRNRERAAQLRKQADSLERTAATLSPTGRMSYGGGLSLGKTAILDEGHHFKPLPGSVREGVYGDVRTLGAGDPAHPDHYDYGAGSREAELRRQKYRPDKP